MTSKWIWPFELQDKLGEGGMGVVYRARYVGNDRIVAVKLLPDEVARNPTLVARFDRELEILTQLRHPNIVHCFGGTTESKQRFYAMELVDGGTLGEALRAKGRISWAQVIEYGLQICAALQYAHEKGVVHRDIKPANFLLTKAGKLKLSDFGLATIVAGQRLTMAGKTAGTFLYMAPEQIRGKPALSNRTDLYALGCVFFELLTGHPPFDAEAPAAVLHKHLKEPPPHVTAEVPDCPLDLDRLIQDLLQKDPERRPATAGEVARRLEGVFHPTVVSVDPFARTPAAPIPQVALADAESEEFDTDSRGATRPAIPRYVAGWLVIATLAAIYGGWRAWHAEGAVRSVTRQLQQLARESGPQRTSAIEILTQLPDPAPDLADTLLELVQPNQPSEVRIAALKGMLRNQEIMKPHAIKLLALARDESDPIVRQEATQVHQQVAASQSSSAPSIPRWLIWLGTIGLLAGVSWFFFPQESWQGLLRRWMPT